MRQLNLRRMSAAAYPDGLTWLTGYAVWRGGRQLGEVHSAMTAGLLSPKRKAWWAYTIDGRRVGVRYGTRAAAVAALDSATAGGRQRPGWTGDLG
jgi:hypothetical protein